MVQHWHTPPWGKTKSSAATAEAHFGSPTHCALESCSLYFASHLFQALRLLPQAVYNVGMIIVRTIEVLGTVGGWKEEETI